MFEPDDKPLWTHIRMNVSAFMHDLFRQGAFQGTTPSEAYFVKCDKETTMQDDINRGIVDILVGFEPLKPVEFVIIKISQIAKQPTQRIGNVAQFSKNPTRFDPYKKLQVPDQVGGPVRGGRKQDQRAEADDRSSEAAGGHPSTTRKSPGRTE